MCARSLTSTLLASKTQAFEVGWGYVIQFHANSAESLNLKPLPFAFHVSHSQQKVQRGDENVQRRVQCSEVHPLTALRPQPLFFPVLLAFTKVRPLKFVLAVISLMASLKSFKVKFGE